MFFFTIFLYCNDVERYLISKIVKKGEHPIKNFLSKTLSRPWKVPPYFYVGTRFERRTQIISSFSTQIDYYNPRFRKVMFNLTIYQRILPYQKIDSMAPKNKIVIRWCWFLFIIIAAFWVSLLKNRTIPVLILTLFQLFCKSYYRIWIFLSIFFVFFLSKSIEALFSFWISKYRLFD